MQNALILKILVMPVSMVRALLISGIGLPKVPSAGARLGAGAPEAAVSSSRHAERYMGPGLSPMGLATLTGQSRCAIPGESSARGLIASRVIVLYLAVNIVCGVRGRWARRDG